ncbi:pilus assembly FimT family protein [Oxalicibacterium faecigallinarum]|uniref:Prepilin-type N-terminal cleavage/methylation domain-containing protein n=1 Tax=Oxalicibacterium faecigallinarum TaxID=573741 RepID=A0A8J3ATR3_9BURK|nr:prepilin-type N-terminal cleavage/methylation domain-containing protein [Oxalicibacterium faecigallinarum]GGI21678.1 hypothetical protein GCM10008066_30250 [Oxalicibacterium faecigallinarum]
MSAPALPPGRVQGLTLIEILVTLTILVALLMTAVPFTLDWGHSAKTLEAKGTLIQAYSHAKALALRNPCGASAVNNAASLEITINSPIDLAIKTPACTYTDTHSWSAKLPSNVEFIQDAVTPATGSVITLVLNNRGMLTNRTTVILRRGGSQNDEEVILY